jgi:enterochelin esterase-like enzyme
MKRIAPLLLLILLLSLRVSAGTGLRIRESMVMPSRILGIDVHFSVCLPAEYDQGTQRFPVVYLLHGLGDDETSWLEYGQISQAADQSVASGESLPMIFVMPDGYRTYYVNDYAQTFRWEDMFVQELIPFIDRTFRTRATASGRALMGYSMGGFGSLMLYLKHTDLFCAAVPLSISVRTDEQYMTEEASGWDQQWGRLFGEPGFAGKDRITAYYKANSPFHYLNTMPAELRKTLRIYIDNGDDEQTLCRSNEELHIRMMDLGIPHEFRVRDGGHSFRYWCSALPDALRFISDAFRHQPYRGDLTTPVKVQEWPALSMLRVQSGTNTADAFLPAEYAQTDRKYPVLLLAGKFESGQQKTLARILNEEIQCGNVCPMLLVFIPEATEISRLLPVLEDTLRIRKGYRFRSLAGYAGAGFPVLTAAMGNGVFSSCILSDASLNREKVSGLLHSDTLKIPERTAFYFEAPALGKDYAGNGELHMGMRDLSKAHEYRVREGSGGFDWFLGGFPAILRFASQKFHQ